MIEIGREHRLDAGTLTSPLTVTQPSIRASQSKTCLRRRLQEPYLAFAPGPLTTGWRDAPSNPLREIEKPTTAPRAGAQHRTLNKTDPGAMPTSAVARIQVANFGGGEALAAPPADRSVVEAGELAPPQAANSVTRTTIAAAPDPLLILEITPHQLQVQHVEGAERVGPVGVWHQRRDSGQPTPFPFTFVDHVARRGFDG